MILIIQSPQLVTEKRIAEEDHQIHASDEAWDVESLREEVREIYDEQKKISINKQLIKNLF